MAEAGVKIMMFGSHPIWFSNANLSRLWDATRGVLRVGAGRRVSGPDQRVDDAGRVDQRRKDLLVPLLGSFDQDAERSEGSEHGEEVPQRDDRQNRPSGPK